RRPRRLARFRSARPDVRERCAWRAGRPAAAAARAHGVVRRSRERKLRPLDGDRGAELPALPAARSRLSDRTPDAHRAVQRRRRLSATDARRFRARCRSRVDRARRRRCLVSSILEALRELEGERPPAVRRDIPPAEAPPGAARHTAGALIPVLGGLAVGVVAFAFYSWGPALLLPRAGSEDSRPTERSADAPSSDRPSWLDTAEAPRARLTRPPTAAAT